MAGFFGPGGLSGRSEPSLDPQLMNALLAQFPGLQSMRGPQQQAPNTLQSMGYGWQGPTLYSGQGQNSFTLSPFEGAGGSSPESITAGLASGTFGKSASQQNPFGGQPLGQQQGSMLSLPSLQLPMAQVAATQGGYSGMEPMSGGGQQIDSGGGFTLNAGDVLGAGQVALDLFGGDSLGTQTTTPGYNEQRAGERADYSNATGAPSGIPQLFDFGPATSTAVQNAGGFNPSTFAQTGGAPFVGGSPIDLADPSTMFFNPNAPAGAESEAFAAPGGSAQFALGMAPQADLLGGGLSTLGGLTNLASGIQSGNAGSILSGAGSTLGGIGQLFPESGISGNALGTVGGAAAAPFAAIGLAQAMDTGDPMAIASNLASLYGTTVPVINAIFGTTLPSLTAIAGSTLSGLGGAVGGSIGSGLSALGGSLGSIGGGAAAGAGAAAGTAAGEAAAGAAAGAGAALPLGMIVGPYVVAKLIQAWQAMGPDKANARQLSNRVENIYGQLPGEMAQLQGIPGIAGQLTPSSTPDQAADILRQLNALQRGYQEGGWESYAKTGGTSVESVGEGNMEAEIPDVGQTLLGAENAYFPVMDLARLRAQDLLQKNGWTPEQIQAQTGRYISPQEWAQNIGSRTYNSNEAGNYGSGSGQTSKAYNPYMSQNFGLGQEISAMQAESQNYLATHPEDPQGLNYATWQAQQANSPGQAWAAHQGLSGEWNNTWSPQAQQDFAAIQPGGIEAALAQMFGGQYANPVWGQIGFGQGLQTPPEDPVTQQLRQYAEQMQGLTKNADSIMQAIQTSLQGAPVGSVLPQQPGAPGFTSQAPGGGGIDLEALLRQLGYLR